MNKLKTFQYTVQENRWQILNLKKNNELYCFFSRDIHKAVFKDQSYMYRWNKQPVNISISDFGPVL